MKERFDQSTARVFAFECSRQLGKTSAGVFIADSVARKHPKCSIRIATAFAVDIEGIIVKAFDWLFEDCPDELQPRWLPSKGKYRYPNGSEIVLVGLDKNPNKLRGSRLKLVLIEEAGFVDSETLQYAYKNVIVPAFTHEPDARLLLISTPPESGSDHVFCEMADAAALNDAYCKFTIYDNPLLTPDRIDEIAREVGGKESVAFRREYLCERIVDTTRALVPEFQESLHVRAVPKPPTWQFMHRYVFLDTGVRDHTVALVAWYDFASACLVVEDEVVLKGEEVLTPTIAARIAAKEQEHFDFHPVYRRVADNNNLILIADLGRFHDLHFTPTSKDALEAMVNVLRMWFKDNRIAVNPRCKSLIGTLKSGLWNKNRDNFARSTVYGHADAIAALMYGVRNTDVVTNPVPPTWGLDLANTFLPPHKRQPPLSPAGQAFSEAFGLAGKRR
jgi:hypothetical protein